MKDFISIKNLVLLPLIAVMLSCNSDDSESPSVENENNLILKTITPEDASYITKYRTDGRFSSEIRKNNITDDDVTTVFFNENDHIKKHQVVSNLNRFSVETDYFYDDSKITQIIKYFINQGGFNSITTNYNYSDNIITGIKDINTSEKHIYTFEDNSYTKLLKQEIINTDSQEIIFQENFVYYENGNLQKNIISISNNTTNRSITFEYDDKRNPYTEGNSVDFLNHILQVQGSNSLNFVIANLASNNLLTSFTEGNSKTLEYNESGYPVKETESSENDPNPIIRIFEYY